MKTQKKSKPEVVVWKLKFVPLVGVRDPGETRGDKGGAEEGKKGTEKRADEAGAAAAE